MKRLAGLWVGMAISMFLATMVGWGGEPPPAAVTTNTDKVKTAFKAADTNADSKITGAEMTEAMCRDAFAKMDKDNNKVVTPEEWAGVDKKPNARERFDAIDQNKDAEITYFEFSQAVRRSGTINETFSTLDKNGDGTLSRDEYSGHPHFQILSVQF